MKGITDKELESHLKESAGKDLPAHKGIDALRDMVKGVTGAERAGHKYIGRMPRAGGGYIYEYPESEEQSKRIDAMSPQYAARLHAQAQRVNPETWRQATMMAVWGHTDEKTFRDELQLKTRDWQDATRQYDSQRSMGMTASSWTLKAARKLGKEVKEMQALLDKAEATEKKTQNKVGNMTNKGIDALRDMEKALRGSEKPGHKYRYRIPVSGGGYKYVYLRAKDIAVVSAGRSKIKQAYATIFAPVDHDPKATEADKQVAFAQFKVIRDTTTADMKKQVGDFDRYVNTRQVLGQGAVEGLLNQMIAKAPTEPVEIQHGKEEPVVEVAPDRAVRSGGAGAGQAAYHLAGDLPKHELVTDSQDVKAVCDAVGVDYDANGVTGALVKVGEGEYEDVWLTDSARPFDNSAHYMPVSYFNLPAKKSLSGIEKLRKAVKGS
jgi:hypothetical protein